MRTLIFSQLVPILSEIQASDLVRRFSTQTRWDSNVGVAREVFFGTISDSRVCLFGSTLHLQRYLCLSTHSRQNGLRGFASKTLGLPGGAYETHALVLGSSVRDRSIRTATAPD